MKKPLLTIGEIAVFAIPEVTVAYEPNFLFKSLPPGFLQAHLDHLPAWSLAEDGRLINLTFQSFLVRHAGQNILVDTCNGNHKQRPNQPRWHERHFPYIAALNSAGLRPEDIDLVLCTHLHADHVGWNTHLQDGRWVPTFPNARYLASELELAFWQGASGNDGQRLPHGEAWEDSVLPIIEAGLLDAVPANAILSTSETSSLTLQPAAGHTPGHVHLRLQSLGREAICCADTLHHPLQVSHPEYCLTEHDPALALVTRNELLAHCATSGAVVVPAHFAQPGNVIDTPGGRRFVPVRSLHPGCAGAS